MSANPKGSSFSYQLFWGIFAAMLVLSYMLNSRQTDSVRISALPSSEMERLEKRDDLGQERSISILPSRNSADQPADGAGRSISNSVRWLNRSLESLSQKLKRISDNLENTQDKAVVEVEIKKAFLDAFGGASDSVDTAEVTQDTNAFEDLKTETEAMERGVDVPVLGDGVPDWIRRRVIEVDRLLIPIESSMHSSLEECRKEFDETLPGEVKKLLDTHVLKLVAADKIPGLTSEYVRDKLIDRSSEFDNFQERPSGSFHQLWVRMDVDRQDLQQIQSWEREIVTGKRIWLLGGLSGGVLGTLAGLSGILRALAQREQRRRTPRPIA